MKVGSSQKSWVLTLPTNFFERKEIDHERIDVLAILEVPGIPL